MQQEWQCPWCTHIIDTKRVRLRPAAEIFPNTLHRICNICREEQEKALREDQKEREKGQWRRAA